MKSMLLQHKIINKFLALSTKWQPILIYLIGIDVAHSFLRNGIRKFDPEGFWSNAFLNTWGFPLWFMYFIGVVEVFGALLLFFPRLFSLGALMLSVVMAGALVTKTTHKIHTMINGLDGQPPYSFFMDFQFFITFIAIMMFCSSYWNMRHHK